MKKVNFQIIVALLLVTITSCIKDTNNNNGSSGCGQTNMVPQLSAKDFGNHYIVRLKDLPALLTAGLSAKDYASRSKEFKSRLENLLLQKSLGMVKVNAVFSSIFYGFESELTPQQLVLLKADSLVASIEKVTSVSMFQTACTEEPISGEDMQVQSVGIVRIGSGNGIGKRVWIVDTGVDSNHPDLTVNLSLSRDFTSGIVGGLLGVGAIEDEEGHGTHVSGIVAAKNNRIGTIGVAAGAEIVAIKVLDSTGSGSSTNLLQGLDYIMLLANPGEVVNLSFGGDPSNVIDLGVQQLALKGVLVAMAAGNEFKDAGEVSPARVNGSGLYTVSAIGNSDRFASYSNFGNPPVDYAEPGNNIISTLPGGMYGKLSGTSMATPHLAGILLLSGTTIKTNGAAVNDPDGMADPIGVVD